MSKKKVPCAPIKKKYIGKYILKQRRKIQVRVYKMEKKEDFGIDNVQIENFIKKSGDNISKNFVGVFPAGEKNRFNDISIEIKNK